MLGMFCTTIAWNTKSRWNRVLPGGVRRQLARRAFEGVPEELMRGNPWRETVRLAVRNSPLEGLLCAGERPFSVIGMFRHFDSGVARQLGELNVDCIYAYEGGALQTFRQAKQFGMRTVYDLTSGYWYRERELLLEEEAHNPDLASVLPKLGDSIKHLLEKDEEMALADFVIVASHHVRRTLAGVIPEDRILVVPYGAPPIRSRPERHAEGRQPLRVLFAGSLHQRKGIGYLLKAVEMLGTDVDLTLIGQRFAANHVVDSACERWHWFESIPHDQVLEVMMRSDVLVLPSISEAFGLVVTEALACGLPVIVTPNVGSSDLIRDGREGFVVPICSADAIADRLAVLNQDRALLARMSHDAQLTAAAQSWDVYRERWAETVRTASWR